MMRNTALWSCVVEALLFAAYGISVMSYGRDEGSALFTLEEPVDDACVLVSSLLIMFTALGVVGEGATIERGECFYTFYGWCSLVGLVALLYPLYAISYAINQWSGTATFAAALVLVARLQRKHYELIPKVNIPKVDVHVNNPNPAAAQAL